MEFEHLNKQEYLKIKWVFSESFKELSLMCYNFSQRSVCDLFENQPHHTNNKRK